MTRNSTRNRIVEAADTLFYESGFEATSFATIADKVGISRGNFYHHFKSKDEILRAVIDYRLEKTGELLEEWQENGQSPQDRVMSFIKMLITNKSKIMAFGCPVGTLYTELAKLEHVSRSHSVEILQLFRTWLEKQFREMGIQAEPEQSSMHLLTWSQGVASIASAYKCEEYISDEVRKITLWLKGLH